MQRLNCHLERVTEERDKLKSERDAAQTQCTNLERDMAAGEKAKSAALEVESSGVAFSLQYICGYDFICYSII